MKKSWAVKLKNKLFMLRLYPFYPLLFCPLATSTSSLCASTFGSSALSPSSHPTGPPTLNSLVQPVKFKLAARRWRNFTYGRLKRAPKMPVRLP